MQSHSTETPESEDTGKAGVFLETVTATVDRKISVAPMLDWTDDQQRALSIRCLGVSRNACLLYVSSALRGFTCYMR